MSKIWNKIIDKCHLNKFLKPTKPTKSTKSLPTLLFEPALPRIEPTIVQVETALPTIEPVEPNIIDLPLYTIDEVKQHNTKDDLWVIINENVYNLTSFIEHHPGGIEPLLYNGGTNITDIFFSIHEQNVYEHAEKLIVGKLKQ